MHALESSFSISDNIKSQHWHACNFATLISQMHHQKIRNERHARNSDNKHSILYTNPFSHVEVTVTILSVSVTHNEMTDYVFYALIIFLFQHF
jgi:hypothetical protein